jgi:hypothetical protein
VEQKVYKDNIHPRRPATATTLEMGHKTADLAMHNKYWRVLAKAMFLYCLFMPSSMITLLGSEPDLTSDTGKEPTV